MSLSVHGELARFASCAWRHWLGQDADAIQAFERSILEGMRGLRSAPATDCLLRRAQLSSAGLCGFKCVCFTGLILHILVVIREANVTEND